MKRNHVRKHTKKSNDFSHIILTKWSKRPDRAEKYTNADWKALKQFVIYVHIIYILVLLISKCNQIKMLCCLK